MEEKQRAILSAIKKDDLAAFGKLIDKETEKYSFGRFPLLSLCYLYGSVKIALFYEKRLLKLSRYTQISEDRESYCRFREKARRVLRLYVGGRTVSPLVMLAVTGRHDALRALYPAAYKDAAIRSEITYALDVLFGSGVTFGQNDIRIRRRKMPLWERITASVAGAVAVVMLTCSLLGFFMMPKDKGTAEEPVVISNEKQLSFIYEREGYYSLVSDVTAKTTGAEDFKANFDGGGNVLRFTPGQNETAFTSLSGSIKNLVVEIDVGTMTIDRDTALFAKTNNGRIENVTFIVKGNFSIKDRRGTSTEDETVRISCVVGENNGIIDNCRIVCSVTAENQAIGNTYLTSLVSENNGTVTQCSSSGYITADTVDISGLVTDNNEKGVISRCESTVELSQKTTDEHWSPNVGGLCMNNYGTLSACRFSGSVLGEMTPPDEGMLCAERKTSVVNDGRLSVSYCDCNVFKTRSTEEISRHKGGISSSTASAFDVMAQYFAAFVGTSGNSYYQSYYYQTFFSYAQSLYGGSENPITKNLAYDVSSGVVIRLNDQYVFSPGKESYSYEEYQKAVAYLFGFDNAAELTSRVNALIGVYSANAAGASVNNRLCYDGAVYTSYVIDRTEKSSFVLPFVLKDDGTDATVLTYVIYDSSGNMYIWVNDVDALFKGVCFETDDSARSTLYGRCMIFEPAGNLFLGGICVDNEEVVSDCIFDGVIKGEAKTNSLYLGGIAAVNYDGIQGCTYQGKAEGLVGSAYAAVGGLVATNTYKVSGNNLESIGKVKEGLSMGKITLRKDKDTEAGTSERHVGGLVGLSNGGSVKDSRSSAEIDSDLPTGFVGGAVGVSMDKQSVYSRDHDVGVYDTESSAKIIVKDDATVGGIVGYNELYVSNCQAKSVVITAGTGNVIGAAVGRNQMYTDDVDAEATVETGDDCYVGGIVGVSRSRVKNGTAKVTATCGNGCTAGGVAAISTSTVNKCDVEFDLTAGNNTVAGGGVGTSSYYFSDCKIKCELTVGDDSVIGGIMASNAFTTTTIFDSSYTVSGCTINGSLNAGKRSVVGGLVALNGIYTETTGGEKQETVYASTSIDRCRAETAVDAGEGSIVGGAIGRNSGAYYESYCSGTITATDSVVGGMIGKNEKGAVKYDFVSVTVTASGTVGSLIGQTDQDSAEYTLTYKENFLRENEEALKTVEDVDEIVERYYKNNVYYYQNAYVKQDGMDAYGVVGEYEKEVSPEAYRMEAIAYDSETALKNSDNYKEVFGNETEQNNHSVSGNDGNSSSL